MKHVILSAMLGALALGLASNAEAGVSLNIGIDPFGYGVYAPPPVVYQPDPYYAPPPPVVYFGRGNWGGHGERRGNDRGAHSGGAHPGGGHPDGARHH